LDVFDCQTHYLASSQSATDEEGEQGAIAFPFEGRGVGEGEEFFGLAEIEPVPRPDAEAIGTFDAADCGGDVAGEESVVGGFFGELPYGRQAEVDGSRRQAPCLELTLVGGDKELLRT